jgi:membrane-associated phospholipid phosphatase
MMTIRERAADIGSTWTRILREADELDRAVYAAVASTNTPTLNEPIARLSDAANYSLLWFGVAAGLSVLGGRPGRHAAVRGLLAVGATSALANLGVKTVFRRGRPHRIEHDGRSNVRMPASTSFPSGHTASAFAFTFAASRTLPLLALPLVPLAAAVAYSRVHTGVHFPGDVLAGAVLGSIVGSTLPRALDRFVPTAEVQGSVTA